MEKALRSSTGLCDINIRFWEAEHQPPRAVLTIMHGMAEHVDRYDDFAGFLAQNGIAVAAADMASHGKSISENGIRGAILMCRCASWGTAWAPSLRVHMPRGMAMI